jgi:hypothetical protein
MPSIDDLLAKPKILRGDFTNVELKGVPENKILAALAKMPPGATKLEIRKRWTDANGGGDPYARVNFKVTPFPQHSKDFKKFEGWFNYFYAECSEPKQQEFYKECMNPDGTQKGDFASTDPAKQNDARRKLLIRMLDAGFVAYDADYYGTSDDLLKPIIKGTPLTSLKVGFRGELRPPVMVKLHDGCRSKATVDAVRKTMGMNEPWHPFTNPFIRNRAYYRNGSVNQDNCLFTAVSVATNFETASKFPLMQDLNLDNPDALGTATVMAKGMSSRVKAMAMQMQDHINARMGVKPPANGVPARASTKAERRLLRCVRMNIYLFSVPNGWNTEAKQLASGATTFPERATLSIPWGNFFARVRCDRIQYDDNDSNAGHLLIVSGYDLLQNQQGLIAAAGGNRFAVEQLERFLDDIVARGKLLPGGKGGIHVDPGNMYPVSPIETVERIEARTGWM